MTSITPPSFQHLFDEMQCHVALQQRVFGVRLLSPEVTQSSQYPRLLVQQLGFLTGQLCNAFVHVPLEANEQQEYFNNTNNHDNHDDSNNVVAITSTTVDPAIPTSMVHLLLALIQLAHVLKIDLHWAVLQKMELNNRKYPVDLCKASCCCYVVVSLCIWSSVLYIMMMMIIMPPTNAPYFLLFWKKQGKAGKYTAYSQVTGITKTEGQSTSVYRPTPEKALRRLDEGSSPTSVMMDAATTSHANDDDDHNKRHHSIADLQCQIRQFALDRQWQQYHQPRNLVLALMGELGELAELFQWRHDEALMQWDDDEIVETTTKDDEDDRFVIQQPSSTTTTTTSFSSSSTMPRLCHDVDENEETTTKDDEDDRFVIQQPSSPTTTTTSSSSSSTMPRLCRDKVQQEVADVTIYLLRLADVCHIALDQCAWNMLVAATE